MTVMVILLTMPLTGGPGGWKMGLSLSGWIPYTKCALKVLIQVREKLGFDGIPNNCFGFPKGGMPGKRQFDRVLFQRILFNHFLLL